MYKFQNYAIIKTNGSHRKIYSYSITDNVSKSLEQEKIEFFEQKDDIIYFNENLQENPDGVFTQNTGYYDYNANRIDSDSGWSYDNYNYQIFLGVE
jgi:hypothetical protein